MRRVTIRSAPRETADILREEILGHDADGEEWLLGSEDDMIRMLGVSRPTLRHSPARGLFVYVLMDLAEGSAPVARVYSDPERQRQRFARHEQIADAVAKGDGKLAAELMRDHLEIILDWVDESTRSERLS